MDEFTRWWMLLSKVPYMSKEEIARKAFYAGQGVEREACAAICKQWNATHGDRLSAEILKRSN